MLRIWRSGTGALLWSYLLLAVLELAYIRIWRVWRGGVLARAALPALTGWSALIWGTAFMVQPLP